MPPPWRYKQTCGCKNKECVPMPETMETLPHHHHHRKELASAATRGPLPTLTFSEASVLSGLYHHLNNICRVPAMFPALLPV